MRIRHQKIKSPRLQRLRIVERACFDFFMARNFQQIVGNRKSPVYSLHDRLLLPMGHSIRGKGGTAAHPGDAHIPQGEMAALSSLYKKVYGEDYVLSRGELSTSNTTSILMNHLCMGRLTRPAFCVFSPSDRDGHKGMLEIEMALPKADVHSVVELYSDLIGYVLRRDFTLDLGTTYFSWAGPAFRFILDGNRGARGGAAGFMRGELYDLFCRNLYKESVSPVAFVGVAVPALSELIGD